MHKKVTSIIGKIFLCVGVLLIAIGGGIGVHRSNTIANSTLVTARIIDISVGPGTNNMSLNHFEDGDLPQRQQHHRVAIEYEAHGITIQSFINWYSSNMRVGQSIDILVDNQDPYRVFSAGIIGWIPVIILAGLGILFGGLGAVFLIWEKRKRNLHEWLLRYGTPIWADVQGTEPNWSIQVNGRPATVLVATHNNMRFVSDPLNNNDLMALGEQVKVFIDPSNADKYTFDLKEESHRLP